MTRTGFRRERRWLIGLALLAFACRAATPLGYMPGSLADGSPFVLCPGSNPGITDFLTQLVPSVDHVHDHSGHADEASAWEQCSFAVATVAAIAATEPMPVAVPRGPAELAPYIPISAPSVGGPPHQARAPPSRTSSDV